MPLGRKSRNPKIRDVGEKKREIDSVGMVVNLCLAFTKCTAGFFGHLFTLIADGLESVADVVTGLVVYLGLKIALREAIYLKLQSADPPDSKLADSLCGFRITDSDQACS